MSRVARWIPIIALIILSLAFFYKLAFSDMILARGDTYHYFYPYWDARNAAFRAGELPLWTPNIFMGAPLLANPQLGTFYPPNWLTTPFTAPDAIRISILMHIVWAAIGVFILFRQVIQRSIMPALLAATIFALSGYLGAHVEQINQLQGLAWMPWLFYFYHRTINDNCRFLWLILLAMAWALQIFSGHTQTVFISGVGLGLFALVQTIVAKYDSQSNPTKRLTIAIASLILAAILAVFLATPQILPTLELTGMSNRGGGLNANEATAFSLPPTYIGRALLPSYDGQLFGEYIGYVGVIALGLAIYGAITPIENSRSRWTSIILAAIGLLFALGEFNPLYVFLAELPGFNLFRVPARWLSLYSLGISILAGYGLIALQSRRVEWSRIVITILPLIVLMTIGRFMPILQQHIVGSAIPTMTTLAGWCIALLIFIIVIRARHALPLQTAIVICVVVELFFASTILPYNDLAPRDVYLGQRFTISQMLAYTENQTPPGRVLSISGRFFDPGDIATLRDRYHRMGMDDEAQHTAFTAVKDQEILFPNLGLTWGIPTIDGFGGGVLPTIYYSQFTSLLLPEGMPRTTDGRLVENLAQPECRGACIPDSRFLWMTDTRYIITDKVYDIWHDGIVYDTAFPFTVVWRNMSERSLPEPFAATEIRFLYNDGNHGADDGLFPALETWRWLGIHDVQSDEKLDVNLEPTEVIPLDNELYIARYHLDSPRIVDTVYFAMSHPSATVYGITLVDTRTGDFVQVGNQSVLSSDIKIYQRSGIRAYVAGFIEIVPDTWEGSETAVDILHDGYLSPLSVARWAIIHGEEKNELIQEQIEPGRASITSYMSSHVEVNVEAEIETYLILADAYYPGWRATVNGEETPIYRANVMFRAVRVPAGESTVIFEFVPMLWYYAMAFGGVMWLLGIGVTLFLLRRS